MSESERSKRSRQSARRLTAVALLAVMTMVGWSANARAQTCMGDVAGNPSLNCTAQDLGIASVAITHVISNDCGGPSGTFTFDGNLLLVAGTTTRYDLGFYIGANSLQATTGTCSTFLVPPTGASQIDGDSCGDEPKNTALQVPVTNVTVACHDANGDGFFDLAICASYDNNNQNNCAGTANLIPSTSSKCQCSEVPTNLAIPHCSTNVDCTVDDGNVCTDNVCLGLNQPGADILGCGNVPNTASCNDGLFCDGSDTCSNGSCQHSGDPCANGGICNNVCNEAADNCLVAGGTLCRASTGICDTAESCTGTSAGCPTDGFVTLATTCRASAGACDPAETCTGSSPACPADALSGPATVCRASAGACDTAETCTGISAACPTDGFVTSATTCRASAGVCDTAEACTGSSPACPADVLLGSATVCRASAGVCDTAERCSGSTATCPGNSLSSSATICRLSTGACDAPENCTGSSNACPTDLMASSATTCRASAGICDAAENCTGSTPACPADGFVSTATTCRAAAGVCDTAEACTGSTAQCPADVLLSSATTCRAAIGVCDTAELCTGAQANCPVDGFVASGTSCGAAAVECQVASTCTGVAASCPANDFTPAGTPCSTDNNSCTDDVCSSSGTCEHTDNLTCTDICRTAGYWATHSGYEKNRSINVGQLVLDAAGPLEVCGQTISTTSNLQVPYLDGLGLTSDLEALCMRTQGVQQRQLFRQLTATALNCAISGSDCDTILQKYIDVSFTECSALCAGTPPAPGAPTVGQCIEQLDCFNNGGRIVNGSCATGTCANDPLLNCGGTVGACPDFNGLPQECSTFANSCHSAPLCNETLGVCPRGGPASSPLACQEARFNSCTIDSCN